MIAGRRGFTLLELLVVLAVLALTAMLALPNLSTAIGASSFAKATQDAQTELRRARGQAIEKRETRYLTAEALAAATGMEVTITPPDGIAFAADGSASGGRIRLTDGKRQAIIDVDWLTGRVQTAP